MRTLAARFAAGLSWFFTLILAACSTAPPQAPVEPPDLLYQQLDDQTRRVAKRAVQEALETQVTGDAQSWRSGNGTTGEVTPLRTFRILTGHYCRNYGVVLQTRLIRTTATRTACRSEVGEWIDVTAQTAAPEP